MPFVRVSRDKRGYEHLYLIQPPKVLYWFRSPPGIKVGRAPFDRDTQRALEAQNPGVTFDWPRLIATAVAPPLNKDVEHWRERRRAERAAKRARAAEATEAVAPEPCGPAEPEGDLTAPDEIEIETMDVEEPKSAVDNQAGAFAAEPVSAAASTPQNVPGHKRRRRRRGGRRRRRPQPVNGSLDQAKPPEDSSNEG